MADLRIRLYEFITPSSTPISVVLLFMYNVLQSTPKADPLLCRYGLKLYTNNIESDTINLNDSKKYTFDANIGCFLIF